MAACRPCTRPPTCGWSAPWRSRSWPSHLGPRPDVRRPVHPRGARRRDAQPPERGRGLRPGQRSGACRTWSWSYVRGRTLRDVLTERAPARPSDEAFAIVEQVLSGARPPRTGPGSCTATSSPRTCWSPSTAWSRWPTSGWPGPSRHRADQPDRRPADRHRRVRRPGAGRPRAAPTPAPTSTPPASCCSRCSPAPPVRRRPPGRRGLAARATTTCRRRRRRCRACRGRSTSWSPGPPAATRPPARPTPAPCWPSCPTCARTSASRPCRVPTGRSTAGPGTLRPTNRRPPAPPERPGHRRPGHRTAARGGTSTLPGQGAGPTTNVNGRRPALDRARPGVPAAHPPPPRPARRRGRGAARGHDRRGGWWLGVGPVDRRPAPLVGKAREGRRSTCAGGRGWTRTLRHASRVRARRCPRARSCSARTRLRGEVDQGRHRRRRSPSRRGPERFSSPDVVGKESELAEVEQLQETLPLQVTRRRPVRRRRARGPGDRLRPARPAPQVTRDSEVTVIVSQGQAPVAVPDVVGKTPEAATAILEQLGFGQPGRGRPQRRRRKDEIMAEPRPGRRAGRRTRARVKHPGLGRACRRCGCPTSSARARPRPSGCWRRPGSRWTTRAGSTGDRASARSPSPGETVDQGTTGQDPPELLIGRSFVHDRRPVGSHTPTSGGLAKGGLAVRRRGRRPVRAGLRLQPARLGAARRRPRAGRPVQRRLRRARRPVVHPRLAAGQPRLPDRGDGRAVGRRRSRTRCAAAPRSARRAWSFHAGSRGRRRTRRGGAAPGARGAAAAARRGRRGDGPRLLVEPSAGGGRSLAARVEDLGPYLDARRPPPAARRLLRHLPRLGGRARPGDAGRHDRDPGHAGGDRRAGPAAGWCTPTTR